MHGSTLAIFNISKWFSTYFCAKIYLLGTKPEFYWLDKFRWLFGVALVRHVLFDSHINWLINEKGNLLEESGVETMDCQKEKEKKKRRIMPGAK